jgi:hypothetical protein
MLRRRTLAMGRYIKSQGKVFNPTGDGKFANGTPDYSQSQSIGVKYAKEGMQLLQHGAGEEKGIEPYDNH